MKFTIAMGKSRKEKQWKNIELSWTKFMDKVKTTHRTSETVAEYRTFMKGKQDEIKDVGGFVGGKLRKGKRRRGSVEYRSMLTLDMDYAQVDAWDFITLFCDYTCCLYSTHKHLPEAPRLRLIIPLVRGVSEDEYQAIARKVAEDIGIEQFDDTTYEASRLMYWPSTSSDGEYIFQSQAGPLLNPDEVLASYQSWQDTSEWPISSRQQRIIQTTRDKQVDPTRKEGLVGSFCRAYNIRDAIETFLADVYTPCSLSNRYSYSPADSTAGVVIYDDLYAYSHHATDPACGRLFNAFDIVRLQKFGELDQDVEERKAMSQRPSYLAMQELVVQDVRVKRQLAEERLAASARKFPLGAPGASEATAAIDSPTSPTSWTSSAATASSSSDRRWAEGLTYRKDGTLAATIDNIRLILENDPLLRKAVGYNEFAHHNELLRDLAWRGLDRGVCWTDTDDASIRHYLEHIYGLSHVGKTMDALAVVMEQNRYHPVKDYLRNLQWDGVERLDRLLIDYFGAEDTPYTRAVIRKTLAAAVARVYDPGCKFDYMLLLVGDQGLGKSYLLNRLGSKWYSDSLTTVVGKEAFEQLQGAWIVEMAELSAAKKADIEALKHFISKQEDIFREAYGRRTVAFPRQCVFVGTTNDKECLRDRTGNRRFWPVNVGRGQQSLWQDLNVDQIWAEAVQAYKSGEELYLKDTLAELAKTVQAEHTEESDKAGIVYEYLGTLLPKNWESLDLSGRRMFLASDFNGDKGTRKRSRVCAMEVWCECFGGDPKQLSNTQSREIRGILDKAEGWERNEVAIRFEIYGRQRSYRRVVDS
ncbi:virulence-associated E family protein [Desulfosporosinus sp. Sb-LF]|uniref:virulence-associated E family protein n=1 Tax=Desulfosporosinus sp. Sb-LF TaxID=2560027 RepID=UPI00107F8DF3|nr:virulence-associated E family protein [Desulfosporosinus sp. Sb-LF]TGE31358.1 hypothetical protein E4K68_17345 [Desulfosporosinus sp. Sb-LF]